MKHKTIGVTWDEAYGYYKIEYVAKKYIHTFKEYDVNDAMLCVWNLSIKGNKDKAV